MKKEKWSDKVILFLLLCFLITGCNKKPDCPACVCIPYVAIKPIAFWYKDNTLYWAKDGKYEAFNYIEFQLDKAMPPTINYDPIRKIEVLDNKVIVFTKDKYWILHCEGDSTWDWYVENYKKIN